MSLNLKKKMGRNQHTKKNKSTVSTKKKKEKNQIVTSNGKWNFSNTNQTLKRMKIHIEMI